LVKVVVPAVAVKLPLTVRLLAIEILAVLVIEPAMLTVANPIAPMPDIVLNFQLNLWYH